MGCTKFIRWVEDFLSINVPNKEFSELEQYHLNPIF